MTAERHLKGLPPVDSHTGLERIRPRWEPTVEDFSAALFETVSRWEMRFNLRADRVEFREVEHSHPIHIGAAGIVEAERNEWKPLTDRLAARIEGELNDVRYWGSSLNPKYRGRGLIKPPQFRKEVDRLADSTEVDPFKEWLLEVAPKYRKVSRDGLLSEMLSNVLGVEDTPRTRAISQNLLVGAVNRTFEPGCQHDEIPVLIGAQGTGKSTFCRELVPWPDLFSDSLSLAGIGALGDKRAVESMLGTVLGEIAELSGLRHAEVESLKAFVSRREDRVRLAYRRDVSYIPRRGVLIGTTNEERVLPNDPSGNRRWLPIRVPPTSTARKVREALTSDYREAIWAEAWHLYDTGYKAYLRDPEVLREQHEAAEEHRNRDHAIEDKIAKHLEDIRGKPLPEIADILDHDIRGTTSQRRLTSALRHVGITPRKVRQGSKTRTLWNEHRQTAR